MVIFRIVPQVGFEVVQLYSAKTHIAIKNLVNKTINAFQNTTYTSIQSILLLF